MAHCLHSRINDYDMALSEFVRNAVDYFTREVTEQLNTYPYIMEGVLSDAPPKSGISITAGKR